MIEFLRKFTDLAHRLTPKWNHAVIWGWPDYVDGVIALEQALQQTRVRKVVILASDPLSTLTWDLGPKTIRVKKNSVVGWLWFCFARYVFFTHPCFTRNFPRSVVSVNVWHGMPLKRIGWMLDDHTGIICSHTLATSPFWADIMERCMRPRGAVISTGLPRNDRLSSQADEVIRKLGVDGKPRVIAWLPTYRKSVRGEIREDGIETGNVFEMPDIDPDALNRFLTERDCLLFIKPHPMAEFDRSRIWSHLRIIDNDWLAQHGLSLYEFLGATDLLISDISSVVIDYLLLDRPVIHAFPDLREYQDSRGFTVEPIESYFVGPVVTNARELHDALESVLAGNDPMAEQRRKIRDLSHTHQDSHATKRLLEEIGL